MGLKKQQVAARIRHDARIPGLFAPAAVPAEDVRAGFGGTSWGAKRRKRLAARRRGVVALWLIVSLPVLVLLLIFVAEIGNLWLARIELENALEAAALAAVKEWADTEDNLEARNVGVTYAAANTVTGDQVAIANNHGGTGNMNADPDGNLIFGAITTSSIPWVFEAGTEPSNTVDSEYGVRAQASVGVNSVCANWLGTAVPALSFSVSARVTARYNHTVGSPELIRVRPENYIP